MSEEAKLERRVYRAELSRLTGWSTTWIRALEKAGKIPVGHVDAGSKRKWWTLTQARAIVAGQGKK